MAELTQNIANSLNLFGGAPSNKWGDFLWGQFFWGEGNNEILLSFTKVLSNDLQLADNYQHVGNFLRNVGETLVFAAAVDLVQKQDPAGYFYVTPDRTTDFEERYVPDWQEQALPSDGWTPQTITTNWSES